VPDTVKLTFDEQGPLQLVLDAVARPNGQGAAMLERDTGVTLHVRGHEVTLQGDTDGLVERLLRQLYALAQSGQPVDGHDVGRALDILRNNPKAELRDVYEDNIVERVSDGKAIVPRSLMQKRYVAAMRRYPMTFGVGPAGTGKTFLAMAVAVRMLVDKQIRRIIVSRPAIEAGERLGFLPGTLEEKISPYLRPLYDALHDMVPAEKVLRMMERETLEIAPLAYMRGRTLNDAFVILDEAQNTTREQMKMFLTRMGTNSRVVVTGDPSQIDLPGGQRSGLVHALRLLQGIEGIAIVPFGVEDVMRHPLVQQIVGAYDRDARRRAEARERAEPAPDAGSAGADSEATSPGLVPENPG
jgi:phosphate starvation-inducible PhoH-like protein